MSEESVEYYKDSNYPFFKELVVKKDVFNSPYHYFRSSGSGLRGIINNDLYRIIQTCNGRINLNNLKKTVRDYFEIGTGELRQYEEKLANVLKNMTNDGILEWSQTPSTSNIRLLNGDLEWSLDVIYLDITSKCNYDCIHCYAATEDSFGTQLDLDAKKLISELEDLGVISIIITGGEPFLHDRLYDYLEEISSRKISFSIFTNGSLITNFDLKSLASLKPDYIAISLDSLNPLKYEYIRGKSDLNQVIRNIDALLSRNIHVRLNVTLFKGVNDGDDDIGELILFAKDRGIKTLIFDTLIPVGRGSKINSHHCEPSVVEKVKRLLKEHSLYDDILCNSMEGIQIKNLSSIDSLLLGKSFCGVGTHSVSILSDAKVAPCPVLREKKYIAGNISEQSLKEIWEKSDVFNCFREADVKDVKECKICEFLADCKGGCKAKPLLLHGTLSDRDSWICTYYGKMSSSESRI